MKICCRCNLPKDHFHKDARASDGLRGYCSDCASVYYRLRFKQSAEKARHYGLMRRYGMSLEQWETLFDKQGRKCAICLVTTSGSNGWTTDHDHSTNTVRGILCSTCNRGLGLFKDNLTVVSAVVEYLKKHIEQRTAV